jgi:hypothetical protein
VASSTGSLSYNGGGYAGFHSTELTVESGYRSHEVEFTLQERRAGRAAKAASDIAHDLNEMTEQEFSCVLSLRDLIKDGVNRSAFNHPVQSNAGHDRWCRLLRERVKNNWQTHCGSLAIGFTNDHVYGETPNWVKSEETSGTLSEHVSLVQLLASVASRPRLFRSNDGRFFAQVPVGDRLEVGNELRRLAPQLRLHGVSISFERRHDGRIIILKSERVPIAAAGDAPAKTESS